MDSGAKAVRGARARRWSTLPGALLVCFHCAPALAESGGLPTHRVVLECPQLEAKEPDGEPDSAAEAAEWRATLETRVLVALSLAEAPHGSVSVRCQEGRAELVWEPQGQSRRAQRLQVSDTPPALIDQVLGALWSMLEERPEPSPAAEVPTSDAATRVPAPPSPTLGPTIELRAEAPWGTSWGSLGASLGGALWLGADVRSALLLGMRQGYGVPAPFDVRSYEGTFSMDFAPLRRVPLELGAVLLVGVTEVRTSSGELPNSQNTPEVRLGVRIRARVAGAVAGCSLGPELFLGLIRPRLLLDAEPIASAPAWSGGISASCWATPHW